MFDNSIGVWHEQLSRKERTLQPCKRNLLFTFCSHFVKILVVIQVFLLNEFPFNSREISWANFGKPFPYFQIKVHCRSMAFCSLIIDWICLLPTTWEDAMEAADSLQLGVRRKDCSISWRRVTSSKTCKPDSAREVLTEDQVGRLIQ